MGDLVKQFNFAKQVYLFAPDNKKLISLKFKAGERVISEALLEKNFTYAHYVSQDIKYEINELSVNIEQIQKDLKIAQAEYERRSTLFYTDKELEDLYGQISLLAMKNKLTITKIEKGVEKPIFDGTSCTNSPMGNEGEILEHGNPDVIANSAKAREIYLGEKFKLW